MSLRTLLYVSKHNKKNTKKKKKERRRINRSTGKEEIKTIDLSQLIDSGKCSKHLQRYSKSFY